MKTPSKAPKYYTTGSQHEFRKWVPEINEKLFEHFNNVESVEVTVFNASGNKVVFLYRHGAKSLSPEYAGLLTKKGERDA